jgi:hypothetical protein
MRAFGGAWAGRIAANYNKVKGSGCDGKIGAASDGLVPDWCDSNPGGAPGANNVCGGASSCSGYDAARFPLRVGLDTCTGGTEGAYVRTMIAAYRSFDRTFESGNVRFLPSGFGADGKPSSVEPSFEMALIGSVGVGAMAAGDTEARDQAFRAVLDLIERPEFYKTSYSSSLGLITLLMMSGNWPTP